MFGSVVNRLPASIWPLSRALEGERAAGVELDEVAERDAVDLLEPGHARSARVFHSGGPPSVRSPATGARSPMLGQGVLVGGLLGDHDGVLVLGLGVLAGPSRSSGSDVLQLVVDPVGVGARSPRRRSRREVVAQHAGVLREDVDRPVAASAGQVDLAASRC